jgi:hypothetical protein
VSARCAVLLLALSGTAGVAQSPRAILVTVLDRSGAALKDVRLADLTVREDGALRRVTEVKPATDPLTIALVVDTTSPPASGSEPTRELRAGLATFVKTIRDANPASRIGLWEFGGSGIQTVKFDAKAEDLPRRIQRLFPSLQPGGVLLEALVDASKELGKTGARRRAIVAVSFDSPETSAMDPSRVADAIGKSGASLWAISIQGGPAIREVILDQVPPRTGGVRLTSVDASALESQLKRIADALVSQYEVTYVRPDDAPASPTQIEPGSTRGATVLMAPWMR